MLTQSKVKNASQIFFIIYIQFFFCCKERYKSSVSLLKILIMEKRKKNEEA